MLQILNLIVDYSTSDKSIDENFIKTIVYFLVEKYELNDYFSKLVLHGSLVEYLYKCGCIACFEEDTGCIGVDLHSININENKSLMGDIGNNVSEFEKNIANKIFIYIVLRHEIEHVIQVKKIYMNENNFESELLKRSMFYSYLKYNIKMQDVFINKPDNFFVKLKNKRIIARELNIMYERELDNYQYSLHERLAFINSFQDALELINPINEKIPNIYKKITMMKLKKMTSSYVKSDSEIKCPTAYFLENTEIDYLLNKLNIDSFDEILSKYNVESEFDIFQKLKYGLPVESEEYKTTDEFFKKLK